MLGARVLANVPNLPPVRLDIQAPVSGKAQPSDGVIMWQVWVLPSLIYASKWMCLKHSTRGPWEMNNIGCYRERGCDFSTISSRKCTWKINHIRFWQVHQGFAMTNFGMTLRGGVVGLWVEGLLSDKSSCWVCGGTLFFVVQDLL